MQPEDIPAEWRHPPIVHLAPLAREVDAHFAVLFPDSLVCVTPQGWMRQWDETKRVRMRPWEEANDILPHVDVVVLSEEDLNGDTSLIYDYACKAKIALMTQGARGCMVFTCGEERHISGFPVSEVDPTGAGDVFAAAFMVRYQETQDPIQAARFANATASFCVHAPGVTGIPTRVQVEERMKEFLI
jgi:sugar/nucleoside kinase (ribokinase family)